MAYRHIPTMTKSHHGGEMSIMIKVGMCQTSTSQSSFPSSTRCQVLCMRGQLRHALWAGKWRGRYLHPCNKNRGKGDPAQVINFLLIIYFNSKHSCLSCCRLSWFPVSGIGRRRRFDPRPGPGVQRPDQQPWLCQAVCQQRYFTCETKTKSRVPTVNQTRQKLFLDLKNVF